MKKIGINILSLLFIVAIHGKSFSYIIKIINGNHVSLTGDLYCEESESEKKPEEGDDNFNLMDKLFFYNKIIVSSSDFITSYFLEKHNLYNSGYYKIIYSPPELA